MPLLSRRSRRAFRFWPLLSVVFLVDCTTKRLAEDHLAHPGVPHRILGDAVRFTLTYNDGGALGIPMGPWGSDLLILVSLVLIVGLGAFYRSLPPDAGFRPEALALLVGGACGNLLDRLTSPLGVVDFIDLGMGPLRFWTFNLADAAIFSGAALLAWCLWRDPEAGPSPP